MKKNTVLLFIICFSSALLNAQVGIGTTAPNVNSVLDVFSPDKGLLMPRVALTGTTSPSPLSAHVAGMTLYNTATAGTAPNNVIPGFYVNDGTKWIRTYSTDGLVDAKWVNNISGSVELLHLGDGVTVRPSGTEFVALDNGNVGIGTSDASDKLTVDVRGNSGQGITITGANNVVKAINFAQMGAGSQGEINWRKTGVPATLSASIRSVGGDGYSNRGIGFYTGDSEDYFTDAVERMRLTTTGRLGIGTSTPDSRLQIAYDPALVGLNVEGITFDVDVNNKGEIKYGNQLTISNSGAAHSLFFQSDEGKIIVNAASTAPEGGVKFKTGNTDRLVINANSIGSGYDGISIYDNNSSLTTKFTSLGQVGIGTDTPAERLDVKGAIKVNDGGYGTISKGDTTPIPAGGEGTVIFSNGHFFGWNGSAWKQLDN